MSSHTFDLPMEVCFDFERADPDTGFPETVTIEEVRIPGFSDEENQELMMFLTSRMEQAMDEQAYEWMRNQFEPDEDMPRRLYGGKR